MDKNKDGVVTLEEFILACQEVGTSSLQHPEAHSDETLSIKHHQTLL